MKKLLFLLTLVMLSGVFTACNNKKIEFGGGTQNVVMVNGDVVYTVTDEFATMETVYAFKDGVFDTMYQTITYVSTAYAQTAYQTLSQEYINDQYVSGVTIDWHVITITYKREQVQELYGDMTAQEIYDNLKGAI